MRPAFDCLRRALCLVALTIPFGALAQPVPCSRLPQAEQAQARQQGLCVDTKGTRPPFQCTALPDFVARQMTYAQAAQAVQSLSKNLRPRLKDKSPSSAPAGVVIAQSTEQLDGNLCWADFVVSDGSLVRVPPLRGLTRAEAAQRLLASKLQMNASEAPSEAPLGRVFDQRPLADTDVARGSVVRVAIAADATIEVPGVVGRSLSEARLALLSRFGVNTTQKASVQPAGEVLAQFPQGGSRARPGSEVMLTLSDGSLVEVPELVKRPLAEAREMLDKAGLRTSSVEDTSSAPIGMVTTLQPPAKSELQRGSVVTLHVSAGLNVPGVVGRQLGEAQAALRAFVVDVEKVASERAEGEVQKQLPPAGTRAAARSHVTLTVSDGSIVTVPPLHGSTLAEARAALQSAGDLKAATPDGDEARTRIVDTSVPRSGERATRGSTVSLTLVPLMLWKAWAAGAATLLLAGGAVFYRWRHPRPPQPAPQAAAAAPAVQFSPAIEFNVRPIEARAGGPQVPEIGLRAELVRGGARARQDNDDKESTS